MKKIEEKLLFPKLKALSKIYAKSIYKKEINRIEDINAFIAFALNIEDNKEGRKLDKEIITFNKKIGYDFKKELLDITSGKETSNLSEEEFNKVENLIKRYAINYAYTVATIKWIEKSGNQVFFLKKEFWELLSKTDFPEDINTRILRPPYKAFVLYLDDFYTFDKDEQVLEREMLLNFEEDEKELRICIIEFGNQNKKINGITVNLFEFNLDTALKEVEKVINKRFIEEKEIHKDTLRNNPELEEYFNILLNKGKDKVKILINFLLYLNHINDDTLTIETAPEKLIKKKEFYEKQNNKKKLEKINKEISRYTKLHIVGTKTAQYYYNELEKAGKPKKPHWRRGHIRFFKHPKFKKEWTYVRPTLIGKGKIDKDKERIYTT